MIPLVNSLTIYGLGLELGSALPGAAVAGVRRFPDCVTIYLEGAPFPYAHILYHRREPEIVLSRREIAPREAGIEEMGALNGRRVARVRSLGLERVLVVELASGEEWGAEGGFILRIDLTPAAKPLTLYEGGSGRPLGTIGGKKARRSGAPDDAPPRNPYSILDLPAEPPADLIAGGEPGAAPDTTPDHTRRWKSARTSASALAQAIGGIDPVLAGVLSRQTGGDVAALWPILAEIAKRLSARERVWHMYEFPEEGEAGRAALYPVELPVDAPAGTMKDYIEAVGARADAVIIPSYVAHLRRKAAARLGKELKRLERLKSNLAEDLADAGRSAEYRHYGDLLVTYRHLLKKGMKEIVVREFSGEREVTIPLDSAISIDRNIRRYFTKAKKGEKGGLVIRTRKREAEREMARDEKDLERIAAIEGTAELIALIPQEKGARAAEREAGPARRFRRFVIDEKHTVYVGKSDADNDILTHEFASPADLWFHAQDTPGSHVILKGYHRSTPHSVIERAAEIAAYFSKARNSSTVPVIYTEKRYVRRPRKSKAGTALCTRGKTIFVRPALPEES
jgi:hypothetical protein